MSGRKWTRVQMGGWSVPLAGDLRAFAHSSLVMCVQMGSKLSSRERNYKKDDF
jgi:hypothetical protein